ncbi:MAG TPA: cache domain-containing protein, partial [Spirochaetia bacterium]|nr:cache domain-containing protein [Spirochaetia bacterium]
MMRSLIRKPHASLSLSATLTFSFLTFGVLILSISTLLQLVSGIRTQQRVITSDQQLIAQDAARNVSSFVQDEFNVLETAIWLTNPYVASPERNKLTLDSLLGLQPAFRELALLNDHDQVVARASRLPRKAPWKLPDQLRSEALSRLRQGRRYFSPVYIDSATSEPLVIMAVPVTDALRDFWGSLVVEVDLKFMW